MGGPQAHMNSLADWAGGKFDVSLFHAAHNPILGTVKRWCKSWKSPMIKGSQSSLSKF
jgi:hypothetical protein